MEMTDHISAMSEAAQKHLANVAEVSQIQQETQLGIQMFTMLNQLNDASIKASMDSNKGIANMVGNSTASAEEFNRLK